MLERLPAASRSAAWRLSRVLKARKNGEKFGEDAL